MNKIMIDAKKIYKVFILHQQGGVNINALENINLSVKQGSCLALHGQSGSGKSTLLKSLYGNYRPTSGEINIRHGAELVDICTASPRKILEVRRLSLSYVSQFLRVIPRVSTLNIVAEPLLANDSKMSIDEAQDKAITILKRLGIVERLWNLAPATFSGGEQQRVNIARGLIRPSPILLLDEPTASLDAKNRDVVVELINEAKASGTAIVGIFHDDAVRETVADDYFIMTA